MRREEWESMGKGSVVKRGLAGSPSTGMASITELSTSNVNRSDDRMKRRRILNSLKIPRAVFA